jgi:hypothetical protein
MNRRLSSLIPSLLAASLAAAGMVTAAPPVARSMVRQFNVKAYRAGRDGASLDTVAPDKTHLIERELKHAQRMVGGK